MSIPFTRTESRSPTDVRRTSESHLGRDGAGGLPLLSQMTPLRSSPHELYSVFRLPSVFFVTRSLNKLCAHARTYTHTLICVILDLQLLRESVLIFSTYSRLRPPI